MFMTRQEFLQIHRNDTVTAEQRREIACRIAEATAGAWRAWASQYDQRNADAVDAVIAAARAGAALDAGWDLEPAMQGALLFDRPNSARPGARAAIDAAAAAGAALRGSPVDAAGCVEHVVGWPRLIEIANDVIEGR